MRYTKTVHEEVSQSLCRYIFVVVSLGLCVSIDILVPLALSFFRSRVYHASVTDAVPLNVFSVPRNELRIFTTQIPSSHL